MSWNLGNSQTWAIDKESVNEIGCIHTCQGLEFDYVGVIIGDDIRYENGKIIINNNETVLNNASDTKFYKLGDREYLLIDRKITSSDGSINAGA